ncbi:hypothetical protein [Simplicispira suum]|uniref:hypothetical protein n=1 Tax=Simplicispira suum TaxID=2109915 RepID=UPI0011B21ED3|nr:hypothetical protein [Simplicispira suum]
MYPTRVIVQASALRVGDVLCFANPKNEIEIESITHREVDGRIGFHANDDTWVNHYYPKDRVTVVNRMGLVKKAGACRYGPGGALVTDEPLEGFDLAPLPDDAAVFYGGKYLIAESMSYRTAQKIAELLGLVMYQG